MISAFLRHSTFPAMVLEVPSHSNIPCILNINSAYEKLSGYTIDDLKGEVPPFFTDHDIMDQLRHNGAYEGERLCHRKDKQPYWARFSLFPIKNDQDKIIYYAVIFFNTSRHREIDLKYKTLDDQFYTLVQNVPSVIYRCALDEHWTMEFMSEYIYDLTGYPRGDFIKNNIRSFTSIIHPDDVTMVDKIVVDAVKQKVPYTIEYRIIHVNGSTRYVYERGQATFTEYNEVAYLDGVITDITEHIQQENEIKQLAFFDPLTGLPNRRLFMDRLYQVQVNGERYGNLSALLYLDLDTFKDLNDTFGHNYGDLLLCEVAQRLEKCLRKGDTVARLGGDEFIIVLNEIEHDENNVFVANVNVMSVIEKIMMALNIPYVLEDIEYIISPSIGITLFQGLTQSRDELIKQADMAMYDAKKSGRNTFRFFSR